MNHNNPSHNMNLEILNNGMKVSMRHNPAHFKFGSFFTRKLKNGAIELHGELRKAFQDKGKNYSLVAVCYPKVLSVLGICYMISLFSTYVGAFVGEWLLG